RQRHVRFFVGWKLVVLVFGRQGDAAADLFYGVVILVFVLFVVAEQVIGQGRIELFGLVLFFFIVFVVVRAVVQIGFRLGRFSGVLVVERVMRQRRVLGFRFGVLRGHDIIVRQRCGGRFVVP